jgi:hypothetical protein
MMRMNQEIVTTEVGGHNRRERRAQVSTSQKRLHQQCPDGTHDTPIFSQVNSPRAAPRFNCIFKFTAHNDMARIYPSISLLCILILQSLVSAHMIEVVAGKKECFFEDLHINDKVCMVLLTT